METIQIVSDFINTVGFPIACVVAILVFWRQDSKENVSKNEKFIEVIERNTAAIDKLSDKLDWKEEVNGNIK